MTSKNPSKTAAQQLAAQLREIPVSPAQQAKWLRAHRAEQAAKQEAADRIPETLNMDEHLVAFIDILGFRNDIAAAKSQRGLERLLRKIRIVQREFEMADAALDPPSQGQANRDYGKVVLALSDAVVIAVKLVSPGGAALGEYDVIGQTIWALMIAQGRCASRGIFIRGGISHGPFYFGNNVLVSPALAAAYDLETKIADYPMIVLTEATRRWILNRKKKRFYAPGNDPVPAYFRIHPRREGTEPVWTLDYVRLLVNEQHRGMNEADRKALRRAKDRRQFERAQEIINRSQYKDAAFFLRVHRRALEKAYAANTEECVRRKYRWLMHYHNEAFRRDLPFVRQQSVDLRSYPPPRPKN